MSRRGILSVLGPGMLVAATGVGAGDLAGAGFAGSALGTAVLWAVLVGAGMKLLVTENLARWQIATGQTVLEGAIAHLGRPVQVLLALYILPWTFFTAGALVSACGVTVHSLVPVFDDAEVGKAVFGCACSVVGLVLVWLGGFKLFERVMAVCVAVMFAIVIVTAVLRRPDVGAVLAGLVTPRIPDADGQGPAWTMTLIGGVGGTLTVICYSYWMRESGREGREHLGTARLDAAIGYSMTALFGIAMVIIATGVETSGGGVKLIVGLADELKASLGEAGRVAFLIGAFAAVFSSLIGVWQAVPYIYADFWNLRGQAGKRDRATFKPVDTRGTAYRAALVLLAIVPMCVLILAPRMLGRPISFRDIQMWYGVYGAFFLPGLAASLIVLNGRRLGELRNRWWMNGLLGAVVVFFVAFAVMEAKRKLAG